MFDQVPARVEQLTTGWLTAALCSDTPGAVVTESLDSLD
jgi:hypothetical protein